MARLSENMLSRLFSFLKNSLVDIKNQVMTWNLPNCGILLKFEQQRGQKFFQRAGFFEGTWGRGRVGEYSSSAGGRPVPERVSAPFSYRLRSSPLFRHLRTGRVYSKHRIIFLRRKLCLSKAICVRKRASRWFTSWKLSVSSCNLLNHIYIHNI